MTPALALLLAATTAEVKMVAANKEIAALLPVWSCCCFTNFTFCDLGATETETDDEEDEEEGEEAEAEMA